MQARTIGTAKFTVLAAARDEHPTTWPCLSIAGPPELPGFAAASVWISFFVTRLTTPVVTAPLAAAVDRDRHVEEDLVSGWCLCLEPREQVGGAGRRGDEPQ